MKFMHISDLHIGKKLKEASLEEDQRFILDRIVDVARIERPDGVLIAGDVYDTVSPGIESVKILDDFLTDLVGTGTKVFMISGNHDSPEKLGFGSRLFESNDLYISGTFSGHLDVHTVEKSGEMVDVCLLPFIKPIHARRAHPDETIENYQDAVASAIANTDLVPGRKRILVTHQFVVNGDTGPKTSDSETIIVGGTESVDASVFKGFDYVALGHLHRPQCVGRETVRYSGTPLVYSKSEVGDEKSVTIVEMDEDVVLRTVPLHPMRQVRIISGTLGRLVEVGKTDPDKDDFIYAELETDETDAMARLREVYPNILSLETPSYEEYDLDLFDSDDGENFDLVQAFIDFYKGKKGEDMTPAQLEMVREMLGEGSE